MFKSSRHSARIARLSSYVRTYGTALNKRGRSLDRKEPTILALDDRVTLTGALQERFAIEDLDVAPRVTDGAAIFKTLGRLTNPFTSNTHGT